MSNGDRLFPRSVRRELQAQRVVLGDPAVNDRPHGRPTEHCCRLYAPEAVDDPVWIHAKQVDGMRLALAREARRSFTSRESAFAPTTPCRECRKRSTELGLRQNQVQNGDNRDGRRVADIAYPRLPWMHLETAGSALRLRESDRQLTLRNEAFAQFERRILQDLRVAHSQHGISDREIPPRGRFAAFRRRLAQLAPKLAC